MRVGLTQRVFERNGQSYDATDQDWYRYFSNDVIIPIRNQPTQNLLSLANYIDLLVITGGNAPRERIETELELVRIMMDKGKPVLGVCHGAFLLTELFGGSVAPCDHHHSTVHKVNMDNTIVEVNSFHNIQITQPPLIATVLATDESGFCESWIHGSVGAVVWHPERMNDSILPTAIKRLIA